MTYRPPRTESAGSQNGVVHPNAFDCLTIRDGRGTIYNNIRNQLPNTRVPRRKSVDHIRKTGIQFRAVPAVAHVLKQDHVKEARKTLPATKSLSLSRA